MSGKTQTTAADMLNFNPAFTAYSLPFLSEEQHQHALLSA